MTSPTRHIRLHATTTEDGKGLRQLERDLDSAAGKTDKLGHSMGQTEHEARSLEHQIAHTRKEIRNLGEEFERTGDTSLFGDLRKERARLRELERIAQEAGQIGGGGGLDFGGAGLRPRNAIIGTLVGGLAALSPEIGAAVAGAVVGAVGVGGVVGGIAAASKDPRLRAEAKSFGQAVANEFFASGDSFVQPTIDALKTLRTDFEGLDLAGTFAKAAPFVNDLAAGIGGFARELNRGFNVALDRSGEAIPVLAAGLVELGDGLGDMIATIAESDGAIEGLRYLFAETASIARGLGNTIAFLSDTFDQSARFSANLSGALEDVVGWVPLLGDYVRDSNDQVERIIGSSDEFAKSLREATHAGQGYEAALRFAIPTYEDYRKQVEATNEATEKSIDLALAQDNANLGLQQSMLNLAETLKDNGKHWETNTEKGLANRRALLDAVSAAERKRESDIASGVSADKANAAYQRTIDRLKEMARKAGITGQALDDLVGDYDINIHVKTTGALPRVKYTNVPEGEIFPRRAAGGPVLPDVPYAINEHLHGGQRVETVTFPAAGMVHPANLSPASAMSARPLNVTIPGFPAFQMLFNQVVEEVGRRGGTVAAIGVRER